MSLFVDTEERPSKRFSPTGVFNFTSLLLSPEDNTIYIGAREVLFALNLSDINRLQLHRNVSLGLCMCVCERESQVSLFI